MHTVPLCMQNKTNSIFKITHQFLSPRPSLFLLFPLAPPFVLFPWIALSSEFLLVFENTLSLVFSFSFSPFFSLLLLQFFFPKPISFGFLLYYMTFFPSSYSIGVLTFCNLFVNPNTLPSHQLPSFCTFTVISVNLHLSSFLPILFLIVLYVYKYIYGVCICILL